MRVVPGGVRGDDGVHRVGVWLPRRRRRRRGAAVLKISAGARRWTRRCRLYFAAWSRLGGGALPRLLVAAGAGGRPWSAPLCDRGRSDALPADAPHHMFGQQWRGVDEWVRRLQDDDPGGTIGRHMQRLLPPVVRREDGPLKGWATHRVDSAKHRSQSEVRNR